MAGPLERLNGALRSWWREDARERIARHRGDSDAAPPEQVLARHGVLRGPRAREWFEEVRARGAMPDSERDAVAGWLREAILAPARLRGTHRVEKQLASPVAHDSDWHPMRRLLLRVTREPRPTERRALGRSLEPAFAELNRARRAAAADLEEAEEAAAWVSETARSEEEVSPRSCDLASQTADVFAELKERLGHRTRGPIEHWTDLLHAVRAAPLDDLVRPRSRWRHLSEAIPPIATTLRAHVRLEPAQTNRITAELVIVSSPRDIRLVPGREAGIVSSREAALGLGRAVAAAMTHPALSEAERRPTSDLGGHAFGALLAHLLGDPLFLRAALALEDREARVVGETALTVELAEVRAGLVATETMPGNRDYGERAREGLAKAWGVDMSPAVAESFLASHSAPRARSVELAGPLYLALRDRLDEDWWRNPRLTELTRAHLAEGPRTSADRLAEKLDADAGRCAERFASLVG